MSTLPKDRRVIAGRTFSRTYYPSDMDPVTRYTRRRNGPGGVLLACVMGAVLGICAFFYFTTGG